jgi:uncharacterized membrane protein
MMNKLAKDFGQGLLVLAPLAITFYVAYAVISALDGWLHLPVPGLGLVISLLLITAIGHFARNVVGRRLFKSVEHGMRKLPVVALLYGSLRDLFNAFAGDKRTFNRPVVVDVSPGSNLKLFGFVTCEHFDDPQLRDHVAVYLPQSYNFAGNLIVVPRSQIRILDADGAQCMAFVVSGGVSQMDAARTVLDGYQLGGGRRSNARL